jgi:hypothetical protein
MRSEETGISVSQGACHADCSHLTVHEAEVLVQVATTIFGRGTMKEEIKRSFAKGTRLARDPFGWIRGPNQWSSLTGSGRPR